MNFHSRGHLSNSGQFASLEETLGMAARGCMVEFHCVSDLESAAKTWLAFQKSARASAYSAYQWASAWQQTVGRQLNAQPRIIIGRDSAGNTCFILPLQIRKRRGLKVLEWHGSPDMSFGYGLISPEFLPSAAQWFDENLERLLAAAGPCHAIALADMPSRMFGCNHPFHRRFNCLGANETYLLDLENDFEQLYCRKRNSETRRANRRKDSRLAETGKLEFNLVSEEAELSEVIDLMLRHKVSRLAANGIHGVFEQAEHEMVHLLARANENGKALFTTHVLRLDGEILAVTFGGWLAEKYWFYISSLAPPGPATKYSPGDLALRRTIEECCKAGLKRFDFGPGNAPYKVGWTDEVVALNMVLKVNSYLAIPWAIASLAKLRAKSVIKRSPALRMAAFSFRKLLAARKTAA